MSVEMENLIRAAQSGSEDALLDLLRRCQPQLRRYASRQCESDDIEEAVQDALWLLYRRVGALRTIGAFSSWLFQIIRRECLRRARKRRTFVDLEECGALVLKSDNRSFEDLRIDLTRAIAGLPQDYREVLILRDITGFSSEEAAAHLGVEVSAAKSRLHRARQMVRNLLKGASPHRVIQTKNEHGKEQWVNSKTSVRQTLVCRQVSTS